MPGAQTVGEMQLQLLPRLHHRELIIDLLLLSQIDMRVEEGQEAKLAKLRIGLKTGHTSYLSVSSLL